MGLHFESRDLVGLEPVRVPRFRLWLHTPNSLGPSWTLPWASQPQVPVGSFPFRFSYPHQNTSPACCPLSTRPGTAFLLEQRPRSQVPAGYPLRQPQLSAFQGCSRPSRPALPHPRLRLPPLIPSHSCGFLISLNLLSWNQTSSGSHGV